MLAVLVEEDLLDHTFLAEHHRGRGAPERAQAVPDPDFCARCRISRSWSAPRPRIATAISVSSFEELGIEQIPTPR